MICISFSSVRALVVFVILMLAIPAVPARTEEAIFPVGSRVGLVPPPGMVASKTFDGFADPAKDAAILIAVLPAEAYAQIEKVIESDALKKQGVTVDKREPMRLSFGKGILLVGRQVSEKTHYKKWLLVASASDLTAMVTIQVPDPDSAYSDRALRAALATLAVRAKVPEEEELSLLPFSVGELAGFHVDDVLRGSAVMLRDAPAATDAGKETGKETSPRGFDARMLIAAVPGGPSEPDQRADFARLMFNEIGGIRQVRITMSEPLRIGGQTRFPTLGGAPGAGHGGGGRGGQWVGVGGGGFIPVGGTDGGRRWSTVARRV